MSILKKIKELLDTKDEVEPQDFYYNRDKKIMAKILMETPEEKKKEELGLDNNSKNQ